MNVNHKMKTWVWELVGFIKEFDPIEWYEFSSMSVKQQDEFPWMTYALMDERDTEDGTWVNSCYGRVL
jgi:hypothetical protein